MQETSDKVIEPKAFEWHQVIHVRGGAFTALENALNHWFLDHLESLPPQAYFQLCKLGRGNHVVLLSTDIHYLHFLRILHYINRLGKKTFTGKATGYTHLPKNKKIPAELSGQWVMGFVPEFQANFYLSVICNQEGATYRSSRYGKIRPSKFEANFKPPDFDLNSLHVALTINRHTFRNHGVLQTNTELPKKSERFFFFLLLLAGLLLFNVYITKPKEHIPGLSISIGLLLLSGLWIYLDYRILKDKRLYSVMAVVSLLLALVSRMLPTINLLIAALLSIPFTLLLLLVPKPWELRLKDLLKEKTLLERQVHSVEDFAYMVTLITAVSAVVMVLIHAYV